MRPRDALLVLFGAAKLLAQLGRHRSQPLRHDSRERLDADFDGFLDRNDFLIAEKSTGRVRRVLNGVL
jgi:hypothetical protein